MQPSKLFILVSLIPFCSFSSMNHVSAAEPEKRPKIIVTKPSPKITNLYVEGSLKSNHNIDCIEITKIHKKITPADLIRAIPKCLNKKEPSARLFGLFDAHRVADRTAGQGINVLLMETFSHVPQDQKISFQSYLQKEFSKDSQNFKSFCQKAWKIGYPKYHPKYMILHGIQAFSGIKGDVLKKI